MNKNVANKFKKEQPCHASTPLHSISGNMDSNYPLVLNCHESTYVDGYIQPSRASNNEVLHDRSLALILVVQPNYKFAPVWV